MELRRGSLPAIEALRLMEEGPIGICRSLTTATSWVSRFDFTGIELNHLNEETGLWERM